MTKARQATATVTFVDEYAEHSQDQFPDVRSFDLVGGRAAEEAFDISQAGAR